MKFKTEEEKLIAVKKACHQWGMAIGEAKYLEFIVGDLTRGYVDETPAQRAEKRLPENNEPVATAAPAAVQSTPAQEEEKKKRIRRTKEQIAADEAAAAAKTSTSPVATAPVAEEPAAGPVATAPAPAPASSPAISRDDVKSLMGTLLLKLGNTPEARAKIVTVLKEATGKTKTAELTTPEEFSKAHALFTQKLADIEKTEAQDTDGDAL